MRIYFEQDRITALAWEGKNIVCAEAFGALRRIQVCDILCADDWILPTLSVILTYKTALYLKPTTVFLL